MEYTGEKLTKVPAKNFDFQYDGRGSFASSDKGKVRLSLYDGSIQPHFYWGNMAFDLDGLKLAKKTIPILMDHDTSKRIGFGDLASFDGEFTLTGKLLSNQLAQSVRADFADGFPFQASLHFDPDTAKIERVPEGQVVQVNGRTLRGPGTCFRTAEIIEGSVCVFGKLSNTQATIFSRKDGIVDSSETSAEFQEILAECGGDEIEAKRVLAAFNKANQAGCIEIGVGCKNNNSFVN